MGIEQVKIINCEEEEMAKKPWEMTNREFAREIKAFGEGCRRAEIPQTKRQASKWRNKRGLAFKAMQVKGAK